VAVTRIWQAIQHLNVEVVESSAPEPVGDVITEAATEIEPVAPEATPQEASVPEVAVAAVEAAIEKAATEQPKRKKATKPVQNATAPRETKLSQVVVMLQRPEEPPSARS
jgi:hypothetical protein